MTMDERARDPLRTLPLLPYPLSARPDSQGLDERRLQLTLDLVQRASAAIRCLAAGHLGQETLILRRRRDGREWGTAAPLQACIVNDPRDRHVRSGCWGTINDGRAVISRRGGEGAMDY